MQALFGPSIPIAIIVGGPISGWIMSAMGGRSGLANWQWLFLLEGIPSIIVGLLALGIVVDKPGDALWLTEREKRLVLADLDEDDRLAGPRQHGFVAALKTREVWLLTGTFFCVVSSNNTIGFWVPTMIQGFGVTSTIAIGLLSAVPYVGALIGMVLVSRHSDRTGERRYHSALPCLACACGLIGIGLFANTPGLAFVSLTLAVAAQLSGNFVFWTIPPTLLAGSAVAGSLALINSIGSVSGWVGPSIIGWLADITGKTSTGLYVVAGLEILAAILILTVLPRQANATVRSPTAGDTLAC
jgi:MFS family permease